MIVVWSTKNDTTATRVCERISSAKGDFIRIDTDSYNEHYRVSWQSDATKLIYNNLEIDTRDISAIYYRRPSLSEIPKNDRDFSIQETWYFLRAIFYKMEEVNWVNHPSKQMIAENKLLQLEVAKKLDFLVPNTILPPDQLHAFDFFKKNNKNCVCKPGYAGLIKKIDEKSEAIYTWKIPKDANENYFSEVINCPTLIQQRINKIADIRVTVAGEKYSAVKITRNKIAELDWRMYIEEGLDYELINLSDNIWNKIRNMMTAFSLKYAAFDFALNEKGEYYFLEFNPAGQWEWLEVEANAKISTIIASELMRKENDEK